MKKNSKSVLLFSLVSLTLSFTQNFEIQSANAQTTKVCRVPALSSGYRKLGEVPIIERKTNGAKYSSTAYSAGNRRFTYLVIESEKQNIVGRVDLNYSTDRRGRNVANIKVCGNVQQTSDFPGLKFNFLDGKSVSVSVLGTQSVTHVIPKPAHTTSVLTVIDAI
ncbi:hypothetical protein DSM106972_039910 [Dulcicalothrix desertica PCC 7102]|uniref:Uncharacterized protein n=1 Tax=Dulcicalothrix desertica PCC 7102 TaxID=232991 RepID=A0A3S5K372_9CYAN|nr:hypothetical protein [Dulcicalothrix desertica]RUT05170.1 hypothetical protein DSM106972_039910 [Dulcicalothrix desertica PCC 7102]TWH43324.1 hypothetical protein CAL7102_07036 [Dulcicalothrix desertica PCC 7102]